MKNLDIESQEHSNMYAIIDKQIEMIIKNNQKVTQDIRDMPHIFYEWYKAFEKTWIHELCLGASGFKGKNLIDHISISDLLLKPTTKTPPF